MKIDPIHQFEIHNLFKIGQIGDYAHLLHQFLGLYVGLGGGNFLAGGWRP